MIMTTIYWPEDKDPSDVDYYEIDVDSDWIDGQPISDVRIEPDASSGLQVGGSSSTGTIIRMLIGGGHIGTHRVLLTFSSQGRTLQRSAFIVVRES